MINALRAYAPALIEEGRYALRHPWVLRLGILFLANAAMAAALTAAYVWPALQERSRLEAVLAAEHRQASELQARHNLTTAVARAERSIDGIEKRLNVDRAQAVLVHALNRLARRHRVRVLSESYEEGKIQDGYTPLFHELTIEGEYPAVRAFLAGFAELPTLSLVREATLMQSGGGASRIRAELRLITYRKPAAEIR